MPTKSYARFNKNLSTVKRLRESYDIVRANRASRGRGAFDHITRSAILFLASAFEVYIEDVTEECCEQNITRAHDAKNLPHAVRSNLNEYVKKDGNHIPPICLCDEGWRTAYKRMTTEATGKLNTPKIKNIKDLFEKYIGIPVNNVETIPNIDRLDAFVEFRGEITHRVTAERYVQIEEVENNEVLIENLVTEIDKMILRFFRNTYPSETIPWRNTY